MAKNGGEMPPTLQGFEQAYFQASRHLYALYFENKLSLLECRQEKQKIIEQYNFGLAQWNFFISMTALEDKLKRLQEQGFNTVLEWEILAEISEMLDRK